MSFMLLLGATSFASAQNTKRLALLIGNDQYRNVEVLKNAKNDARLLADVLKKAGFDVTLATDLDRSGFWKALDTFKGRINKGDEVVFFFAGHGVQIASNQLLLPVEIANQSDKQVERDAIALVDVQDALRDARFAMLVIDACRDNPFPKQGGRSIGSTRGLLPPEPATGQVIVMSAGRNQKALDEAPGGSIKNGLFSWELAKVLQQPGLEIRSVMEQVKERVDDLAKRQNHEQRPSIVNDLRGNFYFFGNAASVVSSPSSAAPVQVARTARDPEEEAWAVTQRLNTAAAYNAFVAAYPAGRFLPAARIALSGFNVPPVKQAEVRVMPTIPPVTAAPVTAAPVTAAPVTAAPVTAAPVTTAPVTIAAPLTTAAPVLTPSSETTPRITWRLASAFPRSMDKIYGAAEQLAKGVSERTGGKFVISIHPAGEIVPSYSVLDAVQGRTTEMGHAFTQYFAGKDPAWNIGTALLFGVNATASDFWLTSNAGRAEFNRFTETYGVVSWPMGAVSGDVRLPGNNANQTVSMLSGWWCRKPLATLAGLKGLKVRLGGPDVAVWARLGVEQVIIPGGEIYSALEKGLIDCAAWFSPYDDIKLGLYKVAPHFTTFTSTMGARSSMQSHLLINASAWRALPESYRKAVQDAGVDAHMWMREQYAIENPVALKAIMSSGGKLYQMPKVIVEALSKAAREEYQMQSEKSPEFSRLFNAWSKLPAR